MYSPYSMDVNEDISRNRKETRNVALSRGKNSKLMITEVSVVKKEDSELGRALFIELRLG
jgi:hypothetical protein